MATSWINQVREIAPSWKTRAPAATARIDGVRGALGFDLPPDLRSFYLETDGIGGEYSDLVWTVERLIKDNVYFRANFRDLYMSFESLLFFGDLGNGDQLAFPVMADGQVREDNVFRWDHETDARLWAASGLHDCLKRLAANTIEG